MTDEPDFNRVLTLDEMAHYLRSGGATALEAVRKNYGPLSARLAMLRIALEDRLAQPRTRNYPPAVFVAYKWEDEAHNAWVHALAGRLKDRGYQVLLDQDHLARDASNFHDVPAYIARLVDCDIVLAVVTERYLDLVEERQHQTSWVFDEYEVAARLHMQGRLQILAVWKDATVKPGKLLLRLNAIDLRQQAPGDFDALDTHFPVYQGPSLTDLDRQSLLAFAQQFDTLMAADEPDAQALQHALRDHEGFEQLYDYRLRLAHFYWRARAIGEAYQIAQAISHECQNDDDIMLLAQIFDAAGDHPTLFRFLYQARGQFHLRNSVIYHYFAAETLFERNSVFAALNHFRWLAKSPAFASLPAHMRREISGRIRTLDDRIGAPDPDHRFRCTVCEAQYIQIGGLNALCGDCATLYEATETVCPVCSNDGRVPLQLLLPGAQPMPVGVECPICNEGKMAYVA
jgi:hypothetical protein